MKVNNTFAGFEQFALSTEEVAMVKGGVRVYCRMSGGEMHKFDGGFAEAQSFCRRRESSSSNCAACGEAAAMTLES